MSTDSACYNCGAVAPEPFYEVRDIPVHSVLLMSTREQALSYPRRDLELAFCSSCGFIQNSLFDPTVHEYSTRYEETQGFSPRFREFARGLARRWIDRYGLRDREVLEIGCGKGEFLVLMCELGPNRGVGIDPGCVPERISSETAARVRFIQDFYSAKYGELRADFICCRHTLEHIQDVREFVRIVRDSVRDRPETPVCFEVPDIHRVLRERAFWDIYYEHCSYHSLGSLARLFRSLGFGILDLSTDFDDQYLLIDARLSAGPDLRCFPAEEDLDRLAGEVESFRRTIGSKLGGWRQMLGRAAERGETTVIWGSGSKAVSFLTTLGIGSEVACVTDINPYRQRMFMPGTGHEIVPPVELKSVRPANVLIMNPIYTDEIRADLWSMGLEPRLHPV